MNILSFGEILWDIIEEKAYIGGAPFNVAAHLAKCGAKSYMITSVGNDELGDRAQQEMDKLSVSRDFLSVDDEHPTGTVDVTLESGQPSYFIHESVAWDYIKLDEEDEEKLGLNHYDAFCFGTLAQRSPVSRHTLLHTLHTQSFTHIFYDVNLRKDYFDDEILKTSIERCTILKLNREEMEIISKALYDKTFDEEAFGKRISSDYGVSIVIITAGERGCRLFTEGKLHKIAGKKVEVVDAVGAGDAFSAAFVYKHFQTGDPLEAAEVANRIGGFVAGSRGAIPEYTEDIKALLSGS